MATKIFFRTARERSPLMRIIPIPPAPGGVEIAAMVSFSDKIADPKRLCIFFSDTIFLNPWTFVDDAAYAAGTELQSGIITSAFL
ncbi:hypothetical protein [Desulfomarina profundi]|uniref:hypothetical protein n=1 Tax=Desulfomarina profundi TaxID=2772557 RepID=UPI001E629FF2|nr:hypothetical protein [Desulfomarina profundi]